MEELRTSYTLLAGHAAATAKDYLMAAIDAVEHHMGKGEAKKNPVLVAEVIRAASMDYQASMLSHRIAPALTEIAAAIRDVADSVAKLSDK